MRGGRRASSGTSAAYSHAPLPAAPASADLGCAAWLEPAPTARIGRYRPRTAGSAGRRRRAPQQPLRRIRSDAVRPIPIRLTAPPQRFESSRDRRSKARLSTPFPFSRRVFLRGRDLTTSGESHEVAGTTAVPRTPGRAPRPAHPRRPPVSENPWPGREKQGFAGFVLDETRVTSRSVSKSSRGAGMDRCTCVNSGPPIEPSHLAVGRREGSNGTKAPY